MHCSDKRVSGIITSDIRANRKRKGFKIIDLGSGKEEILALANIERGPGVSRYRVNLEGIDIIMEKFLESYENSEYVVVDEIGMMEFYSKKFREIIEMVINSHKMVIATLSKRFIGEYKSKGKLLYLTRDNFDEIYLKVQSQLRR